jgi:hypothetical protein
MPAILAPGDYDRWLSDEPDPRDLLRKERVTVGATLPADVELAPVPQTWGPSVSKYRYVYSDNHVMLVEPSSRKIVQVID